MSPRFSPPPPGPVVMSRSSFARQIKFHVGYCIIIFDGDTARVVNGLSLPSSTKFGGIIFGEWISCPCPVSDWRPLPSLPSKIEDTSSWPRPRRLGKSADVCLCCRLRCLGSLVASRYPQIRRRIVSSLGAIEEDSLASNGAHRVK
jgi:hypothetical protein